MSKEFFFKTDELVIWRPTGMLDVDKIKDFIEFLDDNLEGRDPHFSRFIDLSQISGISVRYEDLYPIAQQRKSYYKSYLKRRVKMAFLITNPISYGMARMYQMLNDDPHFVMNIYESREQVAQFLEIDITQIEP